jgi:vanillate O-demethylase monooxygenase subunit
VERHRWIWIWMGEPEKANQDAIPDTQWLDHPEWRSLPGYLQYDVNYLLIADNLLDFSHLPYLHPTTVGGSPDYAAVVPKLERGTRSVRMTKWVLNTRPPAYAAKYGRYKEHDRVDRWMYYEFIAPGILLMDSGMMPAGTGNQDAHRNDALAFRGCQALTPETDTSTHYFFAHPHNFLIDSPDVTEQIHQSIIQAFEEDRDMIRAQQQNLRRDPGFEMVPLGVDAALTHYRRIIETLRATEASDT